MLAQAETMIGESTISVNKNGFYIKRYKYYIENYYYTITRYQEVCLLWIDWWLVDEYERFDSKNCTSLSLLPIFSMLLSIISKNSLICYLFSLSKYFSLENIVLESRLPIAIWSLPPLISISTKKTVNNIIPIYLWILKVH